MITRKKDPQKQAQGRLNRARGQQFEDRLATAFDYYRERGSASIEKTPEPMKVLKSLGQGRFVACFLKKAQPDYRETVLPHPQVHRHRPPQRRSGKRLGEVPGGRGKEKTA